ncbi:MAG: hypothetical protein EBZ60_02110 [Betaproteobacteria bacterium]|nr:hypothetical protein [Betaproteobacteria bacterium]
MAAQMPSAWSSASAKVSQCFMPLLCTKMVSAAKGGSGLLLTCCTSRSRRPSMRLLCNTMKPWGRELFMSQGQSNKVSA